MSDSEINLKKKKISFTLKLPNNELSMTKNSSTTNLNPGDKSTLRNSILNLQKKRISSIDFHDKFKSNQRASLVSIEDSFRYDSSKFKYELSKIHKNLCQSNQQNSSIKFPKINYFLNSVIKNKEKLDKMIDGWKEKERFLKKNQAIESNQSYIDFKFDCANPSISETMLRAKYKGLYNNYSVIEKKQNEFKKNTSRKILKNTTIAYRLNKHNDLSKYKQSNHSKFAQVSKTKLKWKLIKWLIQNKTKEIYDFLQYHFYVISTNRGKSISISEFSQILNDNRITSEENIIKQLFWVFDENGENKFEFREFIFSLELFSDSPVERKIATCFNLCDIENKGIVNKRMLIEILRKNVINVEERLKLNKILNLAFNYPSSDSNRNKTNEFIEYNDYLSGFERNPEIIRILERNRLNLNEIESIIDNSVKKEMRCFYPDSDETIRKKIMNLKEMHIPKIEEKFESLVDGIIFSKKLKDSYNDYKYEFLKSNEDYLELDEIISDRKKQ